LTLIPIDIFNWTKYTNVRCNLLLMCYFNYLCESNNV
jgi:hypothetical protein